MIGKKGSCRRAKFVSWVLAVALLLSLCTGCAYRIKPDSNDVSNPETTALDWTDVITSIEIDTLNVVLVIDTSASTLKNDPARNWFEASCMFLNTLYASANQNESARLPGSKRINADVILYNDTTSLFSDTLINLASNQTMSALKGFIRNAESRGGDSALGKALDKAVEILYQRSKGQEKLSERSMVLLFTDGYSPYGSSSLLRAAQSGAYGGNAGAAYGGSEKGAYNGSKDNEVSGGPPAYVTATLASASMPDFGDEYQEPLKNALKRAKARNYAIYVLMSNLNRSNDGGWNELKKIANYTQRNLMSELMPIIYSYFYRDFFEGMSLGDFTWPKDYVLQVPPFLNDPMFGSGAFLNQDDGKVNYLEARSPTELMEFCAMLAANTLSGSSVEECLPRIETMIETTADGELIEKDSLCYDIETPDSGVSALICFFFSNNGIDNVSLIGPDSERSNERIDYTKALRTQNAKGWSDSGAVTMHNEWYMSSAGEKQYNIATLTVINPPPGLWSVYVRGKDGNRSLHTYTKLVSGAHVNVSFAQGDGTVEHPVTGGDFMVQVSDSNGQLLPNEFYTNLKISQCEALRIPPWIPISGESDIEELTQNFPAWLEQTFNGLKKPEKFLTQMSGGNIWFKLGADIGGNPALISHFDAPLPGLYYVMLNMTSGTGASRIDYSKSFWVTYEPKTDYQVYVRVNRDVRLSPPYLPEAWGKISNADVPETEELKLTIVKGSEKITPDIAVVEPDSRNPESLVIYGKQKGKGTLSFDVTTEYGDKWTLSYDVVVH